MTVERDKFLTEAMGECWHEVLRPMDTIPHCKKCGIRLFLDTQDNSDFSTWPGFGKLWEWAMQQEWFPEWIGWAKGPGYAIAYLDIDLLHPDRFADALYNFLKEQN